MNKTLRNKALKDVTRLITADMNGEDWACPDGYFATAYPIYDGYRVKKNQFVKDQKPDMARLLPTCDYALAEFIQPYSDQYIDISSTASEITYRVFVAYWDLLTNIYPDALPFVASNGDKYAPVKLHDHGVLVAVIMPVKQ